MGLVYVSGESSEFMSALKKNLASSKETIKQLKRGSQKVVSAVNGNELSGAAYTAGKGLFSELIIPTITRTANAIEKIEQELQRYKVADQIVAMEGYLDENKLNQQLATTRVMKASVDTTSAFVRSQAQSNPFVGILETLLNVQRDLDRMSESFQQDIDQLQNKLKKLHNFNAQTSGLFSHSLDELKLAMQGVLVLKNTRVRIDGSYLLPEGINKKWFTSDQIDIGNYDEVISVLQTTGGALASEKTEKLFIQKGIQHGQNASDYIWKNRYSLELPDGKILGEVPGATLAARESAENTIKGVFKYGGKAITEGAGLLIGVGIDIVSGDSAEEAWGKGIITGLASAGVISGIKLSTGALAAVGLISAPVSIGIVGSIAVGIGVGIANDILREKFKFVRDFEDSVGQAVVSGWGDFTEGVSGFIGGLLDGI
ncbi:MULTISPECIES: hypothetical protein [Enterococcus]|uniref:hypothetical protein n=1 Tax=Enterococcus TaxID=1350 RepID=UPI00189A0DC6|nr:hypothetical protein [Enterococcus mundtii]MDV7745198.1 hypothetical protein [Enterococcus mundtii]